MTIAAASGELAGAGSGVAAGAMGAAAAGSGIQTVGNIITTAMQNEQNYKMWKLQNDYNKPVMQVLRLREAGLNPALMYGHGSVGNLSAPAPHMQAANVSNPTDNLSSTQQVMMSKDTARAIKAQADAAEIAAMNAGRDYRILNDVERATTYPMRSNETGYTADVLKALAGSRNATEKNKDAIGEVLGNVAEGAGRLWSYLTTQPVDASDRAYANQIEQEEARNQWLKKNQK